MRLKQVTLVNYRCFERLEIDLHPRLTVLIGVNGAGKTAILDGIATALSPVLRHLSTADQRLSARGVGIKDTDFRIVPWERRGGKERWGASDFAQVIVETTSGLKWDYWKPSSKAGKEPPDKVGESALAGHLTKILESLKSADPGLLPVFAYYGAQRGRIKIPERLRSSTESYGQPTSALVNALDSLSNFEEMLKWFDFEEANELRANKHLNPEEYRPSAALEAVRFAVKTLLGGDYQNPCFNKDHKFVLESAEGGKPLQVSQLSQGYQSMLALGMDFARRLALGNSHLKYDLGGDQADLDHQGFAPIGSRGSSALESLLEELKALGWQPGSDGLPDSAPLIAPAVMLVDEIDLHLHPKWQQRVLDDLLRAFPTTQFIVTTHSPQIVTTTPNECIRILRDGGIESECQQTRGVSSADVLASVMETNPVPAIQESAWLSRFLALIQQGLQDSDEGLQLRKRLVEHFGERHPEMLDCERMIRLEAFKRKLPTSGKTQQT